VEMMVTRENVKFSSILIGRDAYTAFLKRKEKYDLLLS